MAEPVPIAAKPGPVGIRGWLIVPILGFVVIVVDMTVGSFFGGIVWRWDWLAEIFGRDRLAAVRLPTALTILMNVALLFSASMCLHFVFTKRRCIIPVAIAHYLIIALAGTFEYLADRAASEIYPGTPSDAKTGRQAFGDIFWAVIWGSYFYLSERVRNTFVEPVWVGAPPTDFPVEPRS